MINFIKSDLFAAFLLLVMTILALILKNSDLSLYYDSVLNAKASVKFLEYELDKPLFLWVNDGLIAIFFFWVGLEVKKELTVGELDSFSKRVVPAAAALGGAVVPMLVYCLFNFHNPDTLKGFAIPMGTDTAFAVAILIILKNYIPYSLRVFALSSTIFDDMFAIIVIAIFYTNKLLFISLVLASFGIAALFILNILHCTRRVFYFIVGCFIWVCVLESGVHTTLAGMICAFFIPIYKKDGTFFLEKIMKELTPYVNYFILPIFALFNAGVEFSLEKVHFNSVFFGVFFGLLVGKQIGVFSFCWVVNKFGAVLPSSKTQLYGMSILTGIGFTMSFFINTLVFEGNLEFFNSAKLAVLSASLCSAIIGYVVLRYFAHRYD